HRRGTADDQMAALLAVDHLDGLLNLVDAGVDALKLFIKAHALRRWDEPALNAIEKLKTGILFEMGDELAHGGLGHMQVIGGPDHGAGIDHRPECLDLPEFERAPHTPFPVLSQPSPGHARISAIAASSFPLANARRSCAVRIQSCPRARA